jgi:hypothetical protein
MLAFEGNLSNRGWFLPSEGEPQIWFNLSTLVRVLDIVEHFWVISGRRTHEWFNRGRL